MFFSASNTAWKKYFWCRTKNMSYKSHFILFQNAGLDTCHWKRNVCCDGTFRANAKSMGSYNTIVFLRTILFWELLFGFVISMHRFVSVWRSMHFNTDENTGKYQGHRKIQNLSCPIQSQQNISDFIFTRAEYRRLRVIDSREGRFSFRK